MSISIYRNAHEQERDEQTGFQDTVSLQKKSLKITFTAILRTRRGSNTHKLCKQHLFSFPLARNYLREGRGFPFFAFFLLLLKRDHIGDSDDRGEFGLVMYRGGEAALVGIQTGSL